MRLWSLHPRYLDWMGLGAEWREGLLAQRVLAGETRGWRSHPQLARFWGHSDPPHAIGFYLSVVCDEAERRGYRYAREKIRSPSATVSRVAVSDGTLRYELEILIERCGKRTPEWWRWLTGLRGETPEPHPLFTVREGPPERWEVAYWRAAG